MIGRIAEVIMNFIVSVLLSLWGFIYNAFTQLFTMLYQLFQWLGQLLQRLIQSLIDVLVSFFMVIYDLIQAFLYLLYMIGVLAAKFFQVLFSLATMLWAFIKGITQTIASFSYDALPASRHGYSEMMGKVVSSMNTLQLDVVAQILLFLIWIATAFAVLQIISTMKNA